MNTHEKYIKRCLQIGSNALGTTRPNPMVGCVIVHNNSIIGEGYTSAYGGNHAEVNAIQAVQNKSLLEKATLYVTLEPCAHYGKTPPCSDLIIHHKIPNVVIGVIDTHSKVAGRGVKKLTQAGCTVTLGVLEKECLEHHKRFFTFHTKKRPYIILKWAETSDGFIAPKNRKKREPVWITNPQSRQLVHKWRAEEHAILVGNKTVLYDNPKLTTRDWSGKNPTRIVIDLNDTIADDSAILNSSAKTIIFCAKTTKKSTDQLIYETINPKIDVTQEIITILHKHEIQSVIIEGGAYTLQSFINRGLWDEARVFTGITIFGEGIKAPVLKATLKSEKQIMDDSLKIYSND